MSSVNSSKLLRYPSHELSPGRTISKHCKSMHKHMGNVKSTFCTSSFQSKLNGVHSYADIYFSNIFIIQRKLSTHEKRQEFLLMPETIYNNMFMRDYLAIILLSLSLPSSGNHPIVVSQFAFYGYSNGHAKPAATRLPPIKTKTSVSYFVDTASSQRLVAVTSSTCDLSGRRSSCPCNCQPRVKNCHISAPHPRQRPPPSRSLSFAQRQSCLPPQRINSFNRGP